MQCASVFHRGNYTNFPKAHGQAELSGVGDVMKWGHAHCTLPRSSTVQDAFSRIRTIEAQKEHFRAATQTSQRVCIVSREKTKKDRIKKDKNRNAKEKVLRQGIPMFSRHESKECGYQPRGDHKIYCCAGRWFTPSFRAKSCFERNAS